MGKKYERLKVVIFHLLKYAGFFRLSRSLTRNGLRVLCYHGFAMCDEHRFRPPLFMAAETFKRRIEWMLRNNFPVLPLDDALGRLENGSLPPCAVVITIDDGFHSTYRHALPVLVENGLPSTTYVTTYYQEKQKPIFRLAVQYMFWKTGELRLNLSGLVAGRQETVAIGGEDEKQKAAWDIIDHMEKRMEEEERQEAARRLGRRLGVSYRQIVESGAFTIMKEAEIKKSVASGMDIQLHTHRHVFPEDAAACRQEIRENRDVLAPLVKQKLRHFCYPSGVWSESHFSVLSEEKVDSATTCDTGFNYSQTPRYALKRFLDGEHVTGIQFEAEMCGVLEIFYNVRGRIVTFLRKDS